MKATAANWTHASILSAARLLLNPTQANKASGHATNTAISEPPGCPSDGVSGDNTPITNITHATAHRPAALTGEAPGPDRKARYFWKMDFGTIA